MNQTRPKVRISRALGMPLTRKCVKYFEKRPYPPGVHGRSRKKPSDYQVRLLEKQRLRHQYNISETQLRRAFDDAVRKQGRTGENLLQILESRLDATVHRAGLARTIYQPASWSPTGTSPWTARRSTGPRTGQGGPGRGGARA